MKKFFFLSSFLLTLFAYGCQKNEGQELINEEILIVEPTDEGGVITEGVTTRAQPPGCQITLTKMSTGTANIKVCGENINQGVGQQCNSTPPATGVCSSANNPNYVGSPLSNAANYNLPNGSAAIQFFAGDGDDDFKFTHLGADGAQYRMAINNVDVASFTLNNGQTAYVTKTDSCNLITFCIQ